MVQHFILFYGFGGKYCTHNKHCAVIYFFFNKSKFYLMSSFIQKFLKDVTETLNYIKLHYKLSHAVNSSTTRITGD